LAKDFRGADRQRYGLGLGVVHGLRGKHFQSYLDKFVFRFNSPRTRHGGFQSLLISPEKKGEGFRCI
jgi:hypothetical protein